MPNAFAYFVLFSWPLVVIVLFRTLPLQKALIWSIVAGFLLLPERAELNLPMVPAFDKMSIPSLTAAMMCLIVTREAARTRRMPGDVAVIDPGKPTSTARWIFAGLLLLLVTSSFVTVFQNADPIVVGPTVIPPLRSHDALSIAAQALIMLTPFLLAQRFLATAQAHRTLLAIFVTMMLGYSLLALFEARMSPQLNIWIYGFFPHHWVHHMRGSGFKPIVFLQNGLWLGIVLAMAVLAACALWRQALRDQVASTPWLFAAGWLTLTLLLSRNLGATALALLIAPVILFTPLRIQVLLAATAAGCVLLFPILRGAGWVPTDGLVSIAAFIQEDRAGSLQFRFDQEDQLLAHANRKPLGGWGGWGRNMTFESEIGQVVIDGWWVLVIGQTGWLGYLARFGFLTVPLLLLALRRRQELSPATAGLALVLAVSLIDQIPNATASPVMWLVAGALAGYCLRVGAEDPPVRDSEMVMAARWQSAYPGGPLRPLTKRTGAGVSATSAPSHHRRRPRS